MIIFHAMGSIFVGALALVSSLFYHHTSPDVVPMPPMVTASTTSTVEPGKASDRPVTPLPNPVQQSVPAQAPAQTTPPIQPITATSKLTAGATTTTWAEVLEQAKQCNIRIVFFGMSEVDITFGTPNESRVLVQDSSVPSDSEAKRTISSTMGAAGCSGHAAFSIE